MSQYEMPAYGSNASMVHGWLLEAYQESQAWLNAQAPTRDYDKIIETISGPDASMNVEGMSNTGYNLVDRNAKDIVASLSNFRHEGEYKPRFDQALYNQAHTLTKLDRHWARDTHAYEIIRTGLQWAVNLGTGYLVEDWDKTYHETYGDIRLRAFGPSDITFVQMPQDHDIQKAYMTIIREELPLNLAKRLHPNIAHDLVPDRDSPGWIQKGLQKLQHLMGGSPVFRFAAGNPKRQQGSFPTVDVFTAYIWDFSINENSQPVKMGVPGTNWAYTVPALGDPIPLKDINPATGAPWTRPAVEDDCRLFPLRRLAVWTRTAVSSDGTSPWWHGKTPVVRFRFNDKPWESLGKSLLSDPMTMQEGIVALMRLIEDNCAARLDPAMLYDDQLVSEGFAENFNPRRAGSRAAANLNSGGEVIKPALDPRFYEVPNFVPEFIKAQEERINKQMGTPDLVAVAKAKQVPGEGTLEKLLEMAGPLVQDMVRSLDVPLWQLGEWRKAYYFQFYTIGRIIEETGPDEIFGADREIKEFQFTPDLIVPMLPGEGVDARQERAKRYLHEFKYALTESGINEMHRMVNRLALLQLKKSGVMIDSWTIAKSWNLSNYGPEPEGTHNMIERWYAEKQMEYEIAAEAAQHAQQMGGGQGPGRPPTNRKAPQLVSKDGGSRQTVKTS